MGFNVYYRGVKPPTEEYKKKLAAYKALEVAGLEIPDELQEYFDYEEPSEDGMEVSIREAVSGDIMHEDGYALIDLNKLPKGVAFIKVIGSY